RTNVINICRDAGIPVFERNYSLVDAYGADEAFLTGTFGAQTPVAEIDGKPIGDGNRPITQKIRKLYEELIIKNIAEQKANHA
ncbi:MAG: aminotransferase class IV, partial [Pseudomonadota bacterium]